MFTIEMLPARQGDSLWIEYGDPANPRRMLIDGGVSATYKVLKKRLMKLKKSQRRFELVVITHVDRDHIEGIIRLLNDTRIGLKIGEIWFNGYTHLVDPDNSIQDVDEQDPDDVLGPKQGEYLSALIIKSKLKLKWNKKFQGKAVAITGDQLPTKKFTGGMQLTLLSPYFDDLKKFKPLWERKLKGHFSAGDFNAALKALQHRRDLQPDDDDQLGEEDSSLANGSSIALLATYEGVSCLLAGDAHSSTLGKSIEKILDQTGDEKLKLKAMKIAHHGGKKNTSDSLIMLLDCKQYLISTNGAYYSHPHAESIEQIIQNGGEEPVLMFNYSVPGKNLIWNNEKLKLGEQGKVKYVTKYPPNGDEGLKIELS